MEMCKFACEQLKWLGYQVTAESKTDAKAKLTPPKTLKQLKIYGVNTSPYKSKPNLANRLPHSIQIFFLQNTDKLWIGRRISQQRFIA